MPFVLNEAILWVTTRKSVLGHGWYRRPILHFRRPKHWAAKIISTSESRSPKFGRRKYKSDVQGCVFWRRNKIRRPKRTWATKILVAHSLIWAANFISVAHVVFGRRNFSSPKYFLCCAFMFCGPLPYQGNEKDCRPYSVLSKKLRLFCVAYSNLICIWDLCWCNTVTSPLLLHTNMSPVLGCIL